MSRRAVLLLLLLGATWGAVYPLTSLALQDLPPHLVVFARATSAAAVLGPMALRTGAMRTLRGRLATVLAAALVQGTMPLVLLTVGQQHVSSSLAGVVVAAQPVFVAVLARWFDPLDRLGAQGGIGILLGLVGVAVVFGLDLREPGGALPSGLLVLAAALSFAAGAVLIHLRLPDADPLALATSTMATTSIALLPFVLLASPAEEVRGADAATVLIVLGLGVVGTGLALVVFYRLIIDVGPGRASLAWYLAPGFAVLYGLLLSEPLTGGKLSGLALILLGSAMASRGRPRGREESVGVLPRQERGRGPSRHRSTVEPGRPSPR